MDNISYLFLEYGQASLFAIVRVKDSDAQALYDKLNAMYDGNDTAINFEEDVDSIIAENWMVRVVAKTAEDIKAAEKKYKIDYKVDKRHPFFKGTATLSNEAVARILSVKTAEDYAGVEDALLNNSECTFKYGEDDEDKQKYVRYPE